MASRQPCKEINRAAIVPALGQDLVLIDRDVPAKIGPRDVLVRNRVVAINPIDGKRQILGFFISKFPVILGNDIAGTVVSVGADVPPAIAQPGDRVLAMLDGYANNDDDRSAFQTYSVAPSSAVTKLPDNVTFHGASTLPSAATTAAMILFDGLGIPLPTQEIKTVESPPILLVWGGSSSVGTFTIQLARLAGLTVYATASPRHHAYLKEVGASVVVDYHNPAEAVKQLLEAAQKAGHRIAFALDTQGTEDTFRSTVETLEKSADSPSPKLAHINPMAQKFVGAEKVVHKFISGGTMHSRRPDLSKWLFNDHLTNWLETRTIVPGRYRVIDGGLSALQMGISEVNRGVSGEKIVVEVA